MLLGGMTILSALVSAGICIGKQAGLQSLWLAPVCFLGSFLGCVLIAFLFLFVACGAVNQKKEQEHDSRFYRGILRVYISSLVTVVRVRLHVKGMEQIPQDGRFMLVCNHLSETDPVILLHLFRNFRLTFITKQENTGRFLIGPMMHKIMCQPINRENDREALKTIINCIRLIKEDEVSMGVFPEGYIKGDGLLHHFRSGVFKIAQKTNVPIVVCTLKNSESVFSNIRKLKPTDVDVHLVKTVLPEEYAGKNTVEIADMVYGLMAEDLGPELVAEE
ncbi:MAG: 1-acyl-sn-glycerol-3-phosphate acyltransferase [Ruminococcaceae bacterium]|nr:1-acyl-sn-glycerol-3-phosphate acyltransferase [Oscillospiraceae bacterium]